MTRIESIELREVRIPFRMTFRHALAERSEGQSIIVRLRDRSGVAGYGESIPRSYVTGETPESATRVLIREFAPRLSGGVFARMEDAVAWIEDFARDLPRNRHAAFCALELALLDLVAKKQGISAGAICGPLVHREVFYSGVVSSDGAEGARAALEQIRAMGFRQVKVKVGSGADEDRRIIDAAREILGEECSLRVDANCAWTAEEALPLIERMAESGIESVEQPLAAEDFEGLAWLKPRSPLPIVVDESLVSREDARRLIDLDACHVFNLRISKCGGLVNTAHIRDLAMDAGVQCQLGAQVGETAILSAAGRHIATRSPGLRCLEGSFGTLLLERDIAMESEALGREGRASAIVAPGLGVTIDPEALESVTAEVHTVEVS